MTIAVRSMTGVPMSARMKDFTDSQRFSREKYLRSISRKSYLRSNRRDGLIFLLNRWFRNRTFPGYIYPGAKALARAVRVSERTARTMLSEFRESEWLKVADLAGGGSGATRYVVDEEAIMQSFAPSKVKTVPGELVQIEAYSDNFSVANADYDDEGLIICDQQVFDREEAAEYQDLSGPSCTLEHSNSKPVPDGTPLQNLQPVLREPNQPFSLQGVNAHERPRKINKPVHSLIRLFGLQGIIPDDPGRSFAEPESFPTPEGPYCGDDGSLKTLRIRNNSYALAKEGGYA